MTEAARAISSEAWAPDPGMDMGSLEENATNRNVARAAMALWSKALRSSAKPAGATLSTLQVQSPDRGWSDHSGECAADPDSKDARNSERSIVYRA
jgi:hypothetical protein